MAYVVFPTQSYLLPVYRALVFHLDDGFVVACLFRELHIVPHGICAVDGHCGGHERRTTARGVFSTAERGFGGRKDGIMAGCFQPILIHKCSQGSCKGLSAVESVEQVKDRVRTSCLERTRIEICGTSVQGGKCTPPRARPGRVTELQRGVTERVSSVTLY